MAEGMKVEIITYDADPDHGGFGARVYSLVSMFSQFAEVTVVLTDWFRGPEIANVDYVREPVRDSLLSKLRRLRTYYKTDFRKRIVRDPPDIAIVESLDLLGLHQYGRDVPLILDEHNVYWDLLQYEMINSPFFKTWLGRRATVRGWLVPRLMERAKSFEINAVKRATRTLVSSESDRSLLLAELPELKDGIRVLPNCIDLRQFSSQPNQVNTNIVIFVGNYNYLPNREAAFLIARRLAPALAEAKFLLIGSNPPIEAAGASNVRCTGYVKDLRSLLETAAVCIAPLAKGSGTRLKILTYLAAGRAVVATTKACEGLEVQDGVQLLIRDDEEGFLAAVRSLLHDAGLRSQLGANGRLLVERKYDWRLYVDWLRELGTEIVEARREGEAA